MDTKPIVIASVSTAVGLVVGSMFTKHVIMKRLTKLKPIIARIIGDMCTKITNENLTPEEVHKQMLSEIEFIKIAME